VFPVPRSVDLSGTDGDPTVVGTAVDPGIRPQSYRLRIASGGTTIEHRDELGLRYATDTLRQLSAGPVGTGVVEDGPRFAERAFMLDISRDRVPTMATLRWLIDQLGALRYTELQLYTEHTFAWAGHEEVWRDASPLTPSELGDLARHCTAAGLRLVPCVNSFGHMERFLRHERYRPRAECPEGAPALLGDGVVPPTTLAPTADNAAFALDLIREVLAAVPSTRVHIGGDEPFELGYGRSRSLVAERGRSAVYAEHLARIVRPLVDDGREVLFWGDMFVRAPEAVAAMPGGATAVSWWYQAPVPDPPPISRVLGPELAERLELPEDALAGFTAHTRAFADTGFPFWVAPGTSSWNSLVGRWPNARGNIDDAVAVGSDRGADGVLVTDWGDNGHHQPLACSLPAIVHAAAAAWGSPPAAEQQIAGVIDDRLGTEGAGALLIDLGSVDEGLGVRQFNGGALHAALLGTLRPPRRPQIDSERVEAAAAVLDEAMGFAPPGDDRLSVIAAEVRAAATLARVGLGRLAETFDIPQQSLDPGPDLDLAVEAQRAAWLGSSRPGGLADSLRRLPRIDT
jgi:hexosaminidase